LQSVYVSRAGATIYPAGRVSHNSIGDDDIPGVGLLCCHVTCFCLVRVTLAALTNSSHAPDNGKHSASTYLSDNSCCGTTEDLVAYGRLLGAPHAKSHTQQNGLVAGHYCQQQPSRVLTPVAYHDVKQLGLTHQKLMTCHGSSGWSPASHRGSQVQFQAGPCGICGGQSRIKFFLQVFQLSPVRIIPPILHIHLSPTAYGTGNSQRC
jgi:hypothetical protein